MHWQLDLSLHSPVCGFPYSQQAVYAHPDDFPIFLDENYRKVNIEFLSHTANFFKYHIRNPQEQTLYHLFEQLEDHEKPRPWEARLFQGPGVKKLGKKWKGSYGISLLSPLPKNRRASYSQVMPITSIPT